MESKPQSWILSEKLVGNMKTFITNFSNIGNQPSLRFGVFYREFFDIHDAKVWDTSVAQLSDFIIDISSAKLKKGELDESEYLIDLANIERRFNSLIDIETVSEIGSDKSILGEGDIIIPKIQPRMGNIFTNLEHNRYLASSELVEYKCISNRIHPKILFYLLTHPVFQCALFATEGGKTHRRVSPSDLLLYKIPIIGVNEQKSALSQIIDLETQIDNLKSQIIPFNDIIDSIFERHIGIKKSQILDDYKAIYFCNLDLLISSDIRSSVRFNNPKYSYLNSSVLTEHTFTNVLDSSKTTLGRQMSPDYILEDSDVFYVNTNSIKLSGFDESVLTPISHDFYDKNMKLRVEKGDILLIASGEGSIGRSCIYDSEIDCVTSQFVMKLHPKSNTDIHFLNYYMHSFYFQFCVEKFKKGKGNMTNIFVSQVLAFPLYYPSERIRESINQEISDSLFKQATIKNDIAKLRSEIDGIIDALVQ